MWRGVVTACRTKCGGAHGICRHSATNMPYELRPQGLLLTPVFYQLPDHVLYRIALLAAITPQPPRRHRYRLRAESSASHGSRVAPCVRPLTVYALSIPPAAAPPPS